MDECGHAWIYLDEGYVDNIDAMFRQCIECGCVQKKNWEAVFDITSDIARLVEQVNEWKEREGVTGVTDE